MYTVTITTFWYRFFFFRLLWTMWSYSHHMRSMGWGLRPGVTKCSSISQDYALLSPSLRITHWWWTWPWSILSTTPKDYAVYVVEHHVSVEDSRWRMTVAVIKPPMTGCMTILWSQPVFLNQRTSPVILSQILHPLIHHFLLPPALQAHYVICYSTRKLQTLTCIPGQGICVINDKKNKQTNSNNNDKKKILW